MGKKLLGWIFLIFCILVGVNYLFTLAGNFFHYGYGGPVFAESGGAQPSLPLPVIHMSFFNQTGEGENYITQGYGRTAYSYLYIGGWHNGIDIAADFGTPVYSPTAGTVLAVVNQDAYCPRTAFGKYVAVDDPANQLVLVFSHLGTFAVSKGEQISKGTRIGTVGPTGLETGPHLLISIFEEQGFTTTPAHGCGPYPQGHDVDPLNYLGTVYQ
jgi:murein DD-endopeptidase MepM/ murein hydrolase activator NlpD